MAKGIDKSLVKPLPKKGNLKQCRNYSTISVISHSSKIMLRVILNQLKANSEELLAEEQAGFRPGQSTVEQIFNSPGIIAKHLQHTQKSNEILDQARAKQNRSSVVQLSQRSSYNTSAVGYTASQTSRRHLTESDMYACSKSSKAATQRKDWFKPFPHYSGKQLQRKRNLINLDGRNK